MMWNILWDGDSVDQYAFPDPKYRHPKDVFIELRQYSRLQMQAGDLIIYSDFIPMRLKTPITVYYK